MELETAKIGKDWEIMAAQKQATHVKRMKIDGVGVVGQMPAVIGR